MSKKIFKILTVIFAISLLLNFNVSAESINSNETSSEESQETKYDAYNLTGITKWISMPMVSNELLQNSEVTLGGEGGQWPIAIASSKDGTLMLYGTDVGGIYRSEDSGKTWEQSNSGLQSRGVGAFAIDPNNSNYVLAVGINSGSYKTNGIHLSKDGGKTWEKIKTFLIQGHRDVRDSIAFDESSFNREENRSMIAYYSTAYETEDNGLSEDEKGLYKSTDGGYTWELINSVLCDATIKINPQTGEVYASKADGIYYSCNKGESFEKIVSDDVTGFDLVSNDNGVKLYYCSKSGIYFSRDGQSFALIDSANYNFKNPMNLRVSEVDSNNMLLIDCEGSYQNYPYYSHDGGITWTKSTLSNNLNFLPYNNRLSIPLWSKTDKNKVWIFSQGDFISSSNDGGVRFQWDSNGITGILSGGNVHFNVYNSDIIYFGSQDYNGCVTTDSGQTWTYVNMSGYGWGGFCYGGYAVDEKTYFVGSASSWKSERELLITFDAGETVVDTGLTFSSGNESSYQSPTDPKVLFAADLRSDDSGATWKKMEGCSKVFTYNPKGEKELYGINETGEYVVVSYDSGITWQKVNKSIFAPIPSSSGLQITDLAYDWKNDAVYVAAGNSYLYRVYVSSGKSEYVLNSHVEEYKNAPVGILGYYVITKVAVDPNDPNIIYCGGAGNTCMNDCALYRSVDGGKTFQVVTSNTENSIITSGLQGGFETNSIEVNPKTGELLFAGGCFGLSKLTPPYQINNG